MGCPAKKVCNVAAGSALMKDEAQVARILEAVVKAVPDTPVTLKTRTGWDSDNRNVLNILRIAQDAGVRALAVHGRTRAQQYTGHAEYETIAAVKAEAHIPIIANGDITSPEKARAVLEATGADALMIGRAAQGRPWLFREIEHFLATGEHLAAPRASEILAILSEHLDDLYSFYGTETGVRVARKHISWYTKGLVGSAAFRHAMNVLPTIAEQRAAIETFFATLTAQGDTLRYVGAVEGTMQEGQGAAPTSADGTLHQSQKQELAA
jgi:tRNA-dihydrouridine synthase B